MSLTFLNPPSSDFRELERRIEGIANTIDGPKNGLSYLPTRRRKFASFAMAAVIFPRLLPRMMVADGAVQDLGGEGPTMIGLPRVGRGGEEFLQLKFRTMYTGSELRDREAVQHKDAQDPRVIPELRYLRESSKDELPQFINVLQGEMSMNGPRPVPTPEFLHRVSLPGGLEWGEIYLIGGPAVTGVVQNDPVLRNNGLGDYGLALRNEAEIQAGYNASVANDALEVLRTIRGHVAGV